MFFGVTCNWTQYEGIAIASRRRSTGTTPQPAIRCSPEQVFKSPPYQETVGGWTMATPRSVTTARGGASRSAANVPRGTSSGQREGVCERTGSPETSGPPASQGKQEMQQAKLAPKQHALVTAQKQGTSKVLASHALASCPELASYTSTALGGELSLIAGRAYDRRLRTCAHLMPGAVLVGFPSGGCIH